MKPDRSSVSSATDILSIAPARPAGTSRKRTPITHAVGQTAAQCVELLETRALQTADPIMGPLESPEALQNEIDLQTSHLQTLEQSYAAAASEREDLQEDRVELDADYTEKTGQIEVLTADQDERTLQMSALEQQIEETDARIATLEASGGAFAVNWLSEGTPFGTVPGTNGKESFAVTLSPDGLLMARGDRAGTVELIDTITGQRLFTAQQSGYVCDLAFDETGRRLASVHTSGAVMIMDTQTRTVTTRTTPTDRMFGSMQWAGDEIYISLQELGCIRIINAQTGATRSIQASGMTNGLARVGSDAIFAAGPTGPVSLFSRQGALLAQAPSPGIALTAAASRDGSMMAVVTWDGNVTVYNRSLQVIGQASGAGKGYRLTFLGNKGLVTYDANGRLLVFTLADMQNGQLGSPQIISTTPHQGFSNTMGVTPDGSGIVNIDPNNGLRLTRMPAHLITSTSAPALAAEQATRTGLIESLETLESAMTTAQAALTALEQEKADLEIAALTSDTLLEEINVRLTELQEDIDDTQAQIQALQDRLDALDAVFMEMSPDTDALAAELSASIQSALDADAERIGYAKMFVSIENLSTGDTRLHIRFRNPGEQTIVNMRIGGTSLGNLAATTPTVDGLASITLRPGDGYDGSFVLQLQDGQTREVLTEVYGTYDRYSRSASISTTQTPFDTEETGMLAENPITPALHLGRMDQGTLLLVVETPFDQFYIDTTMAGILSTAEGSVSGGTTFGLAQITVDTGRPTGYHTIRLYDRKGGQVIDTLTVYFDQPSRTLNLANPSDQYSGSSSIEETDLGQQQQAMQALQNIPLGVAYADIARNQRLNLYYDTITLQAPHDLANFDWREMLYATPQYAKYRPENIRQTIEQEWDRLGTYMEGDTLRHHYGYSYAQTNVELGKRQLERDFAAKMVVYEQGVSECLQAAVNIFLGITQGQPEEPLRRIYDELYAQWSANGIIQSLAGIGLTMPHTWTLRMAAKEVFYRKWEYLVQTQVDVQNVRESDEAKLRRGELKDVEGNWHAATDENSPKPLPSGMSASQVRLATRILNTLNSSTDPRIRAIQNMRLQEVALQVASIQTTDPQEFQQAQQEILMNAAKASAADEFVRTHESDIGNTIQDIGMENSLSTSESLNVFRWIQEEPALLTNAGFDGSSFTSLRTAVSNLIGGIFSIPTAYATNLSEVSEGYGMINVTPSLSVNANSAVGSLFINMTHMLFDNPDVKNQVNVAHSIQKVTGIPWVKIMNCVFNDLTRNASDVAIGKLADLFRQGQYAGIFNPSGNESMILSSATDKDVSSPYTFANQNIRIRFDYQTPSRSFDHIAIYLADENGTQILDTPVAYSTNRNYFIDVPMEAVKEALKAVWQKNHPNQQWNDAIWLHGNFRFKVAIWPENAQGSPALQGNVLTNAFSIDGANEGSIDPALLMGNVFTLLSETEQSILRGAFNFGKLEGKNKELITWLMNNYVSNQSSEAHRFTSIVMKDGKPMLVGSAYDNIVRDEAGEIEYNQDGTPKTNLNGQCKYWIQQMISNELQINLPSNITENKLDSNGQVVMRENEAGNSEAIQTSFRWQESNAVRPIAQSIYGGNLSQDIKSSAHTGDIIQYSGSIQHTVIVGKITENGIWVFDSNYREDVTPAYHFISDASLSNVGSYTIYRLN